MSKNSPIRSLVKFCQLCLSGRVHFPRQRVGEMIELDGEKWVIFRQMVIDPRSGQPEHPGAIFRPRFHVAGMSPRLNKIFSWLPVPFFAGMPGLRSKLWLLNPQNGDFSGYYEWDSVEDADNYGHSLAAKFMTARSVPGSVSFRVMPL